MFSVDVVKFMAHNHDLKAAIERHSHPELFGYSICAGEDTKQVKFIISVGKERATVGEKQITVMQPFDADGTIDYTLVLTKALLMYDQ